MTSAALPRSSRSRVLIGLLLALLVQAGWLLLLQLGRHDARSLPKKPPLLEMRLIAPAVRVPPPSPVTGSNTPAAVARLRLPRRADEDEAPVPVSISTLPVQAVPESSVAPPSAPLNLALPAERAASSPRPLSMLSQMLNDPRATHGKRTVESAVADAAGTLPVTIQASTDGTQSKLIRQGSKCIRVSESRIKTLNPMDENSKGAPDVVGSCF